MRVKSVREHQNIYGVADGAPTKKTVGTEYTLAGNHAETLIAAGLVEEVKADKSAKPAAAKAD